MGKRQADAVWVRCFTEEHKRNIARANFGKALSVSHREAISVANQGRAHRLCGGRQVANRAVELRGRGHTISDIAGLLGVSRSTIYNMLSGRHWSTKH